MKKHIRIIIVLFIFSFSCTKSQLDKINTDPNKSPANQFEPNLLLSNAQFNYANIGYYQLIYQSTMMQAFASSYYYYNNGDKYINSANFTDYQGKIFDQGYSECSTIRQMQQLANNKNPNAYSNLINIGDIMFVLIMQRTTDMYGDVPYSQAIKAQEGIKFPVYDLQKDIYNQMLSDLDNAIQKLDENKDKPTADLFYKGDIQKWKRLGYSLMLKIAMRLTKVDLLTAQNWAEKAANMGTFSSIDDNAIVQTDASNNKTQNGVSLALRTLSDYTEVRWSKTLIDYLKNTNDPRLAVIGEVPPDGLAKNQNQALFGNSDVSVQLGMPNGYDLLGGQTDIRNSESYPGGTGSGSDFAPLGKYSRPRTAVYLKLGGPNIVMTYAESELLLAEAKLRGWHIAGTAASHYKNGVEAAMRSIAQFDESASIPVTKISAYINAYPLDESSTSNALKMINTQYWVTTATTFNFIENWFNWKRSGYPQLTPVKYPGNVTGGTIPRRMIYLSTEILNNPINYKLAVSRLADGDALTSRVWWDK